MVLTILKIVIAFKSYGLKTEFTIVPITAVPMDVPMDVQMNVPMGPDEDKRYSNFTVPVTLNVPAP